ncbi:MAG: cupredoxin domain-containing protein [Thaumarchaeota archaeon]|nr:cupredoxin domain-containing protein [Nitrososphaerota archaeon]
MPNNNAILAVAAVAIVLAGGALVLSLSPKPSVAATPTTRTIYMAAVEPKGSATIDKEPFPTKTLPAGGGMALKAPDKDGKWEVEIYRWDPATIVVTKGDDVTLKILGINGKEHSTTIEGYGQQFTVKRGELTEVTFKADKAGVFKIKCQTHQPTMEADLVVLGNP